MDERTEKRDFKYRKPKRKPCQFCVDKIDHIDYKDVPILQLSRCKEMDGEDVIGYATPFYAIAVQSRLPEGMKLATLSDLEKSITLKDFEFKNIPLAISVDVGIMLSGGVNPARDWNLDPYLARNLTAQINARGEEIKKPVMIPLTGLELKRDSNSRQGLSFRLKEDAQIIRTKCLIPDGEYKGYSAYNINPETGLPEEFGNDCTNPETGLKERSKLNPRTRRLFTKYPDIGNVIMSLSNPGLCLWIYYGQNLPSSHLNTYSSKRVAIVSENGGKK